MKKTGMGILLLLCLAFQSLQGDEVTEPLKLYTRAMELLIDQRVEEALPLLKIIQEEYPGSEVAGKAEILVAYYSRKLDHSGIIPFYTGWLMTADFITIGVPVLFDITDPLVLGGTGILGICAGLGTSWLLTRNADITLGQDLWIEFIQTLGMVNYELLFLGLADPLFSEEMIKWNLGGLMTIALGSRLGIHRVVKNSLLDEGRIAFMYNAYFWSHYYFWLTDQLILQSENQRHSCLWAAAVTSLVPLGAYYLYDHLDWSLNRSGLVTLSGIGGSLIGGLLATMLSVEDQEIWGTFLIAGALGGTAAGGFFTRELDASSSANPQPLSFSPVMTEKGYGFQMAWKL